MGNFCSYHSSRFIELSLLVNNSINSITTIIGLILINWEHGGSKGLILYIFLISLNIINEIFLILILLWRKKHLLKEKYHSKAINFCFIGMILCISIIVIYFIAEIIIKINFEEKDYPCKKYKNVSFSFFRRLLKKLNSIEEDKGKENLCDTLDRNYYTKTITKIEMVMLYLTSTIVEFLSIINACLWNVLLKRIKIVRNNSIIERNIPYIDNYLQNGILYPYRGDLIMQGNINPQIRQINVMQNNFRGIISFPYTNQIYYQNNFQKNDAADNNKENKDNRDIMEQRDRSEHSLNIKSNAINTLKLFNKKIYK